MLHRLHKHRDELKKRKAKSYEKKINARKFIMLLT